MSRALYEALQLGPPHGGVYATEVATGWGQGRGQFGGLTAGLLIRGMESAAADPERRLRTFTCTFCGAIEPGPAQVEVSVERQTGSLTHVVARMLQHDHAVVTGAACFARPRALDADHDRSTLPDVAPADTILSVPDGAMPPEFTQHYEYRVALGGFPMSGAPQSIAGAWVRPRAPAPIDAVGAVALSDTVWPAVLTTIKGPRAVATLSLTINVCRDLPDLAIPVDGFWLSSRTAEVTHEGYSAEQVRLFTPDGKLALEGTQLVAIIR